MKTFKLKHSFLFGLLCFCSFLNANPTEFFQKGNEAFEAGNYGAAINSYEKILESGQHSTEVYFNLGNAYFKNNKVGKAILNYERGLKLSDGNGDILKNLAIAQSKTIDEIESLPPFFVTQFFGSIRDVLSSFGWAIFSLLFLWIGLAIFIFKNLKKNIPLPTNLRKPIAMISLSLAAVGFLFGFAKNHQDQNFQEAIVLVKKTGLKEAADAASSDFLSLHEGTKVELLDKIGEWLKVRLADGDEGWLNEKEVEVI